MALKNSIQLRFTEQIGWYFRRNQGSR